MLTGPMYQLVDRQTDRVFPINLLGLCLQGYSQNTRHVGKFCGQHLNMKSRIR